MRFALLILSPPESGPSGRSALRFARALLAAGHDLQRVFFFSDGAYQAQGTAVAVEGETLAEAWATLAGDCGAELIACVSSALKRGILDTGEAQRHGMAAATLHPAVQIGGLGLLHESLRECDRVVTFGGGNG